MVLAMEMNEYQFHSNSLPLPLSLPILGPTSGPVPSASLDAVVARFSFYFFFFLFLSLSVLFLSCSGSSSPASVLGPFLSVSTQDSKRFLQWQPWLWEPALDWQAVPTPLCEFLCLCDLIVICDILMCLHFNCCFWCCLAWTHSTWLSQACM